MSNKIVFFPFYGNRQHFLRPCAKLISNILKKKLGFGVLKQFGTTCRVPENRSTLQYMHPPQKPKSSKLEVFTHTIPILKSCLHVEKLLPCPFKNIFPLLSTRYKQRFLTFLQHFSFANRSSFAQFVAKQHWLHCKNNNLV